MNKLVKYSLLILAIVLVAYKSVYVEKLSVRNSKTAVKFDPDAFCLKLWQLDFGEKISNAVPLSQLMDTISKNPEEGFSRYTRSLAIGNYRYALVSASVKIDEINEDDIRASFAHGDSILHMIVAKEFIYGNAVRDASGLIDVKDFPNTADLNAISESLNSIVRGAVVSDLQWKVHKGDKIKLVAAVELNKEHINWQGLEMIPVRFDPEK